MAALAVGLAPSACDDTPTDLSEYEQVVVVNDARAGDWPAAPQTITAARLDGDSLFLDVSYSGGCEDHVFRLIVSRTFAESFPVQTWAVLAHDDRGDPCDGILSDTLAFDLTPLAQAYRAAYGGSGGEIVIHLDGLAESLHFVF